MIIMGKYDTIIVVGAVAAGAYLLFKGGNALGNLFGGQNTQAGYDTAIQELTQQTPLSAQIIANFQNPQGGLEAPAPIAGAVNNTLNAVYGSGGLVQQTMTQTASDLKSGAALAIDGYLYSLLQNAGITPSPTTSYIYDPTTFFNSLLNDFHLIDQATREAIRGRYGV